MLSHRAIRRAGVSVSPDQLRFKRQVSASSGALLSPVAFVSSEESKVKQNGGSKGFFSGSLGHHVGF
jgi:hypothetical protein